MISCQDQSVLSAGAVDLKQLLPDGICCSLVPGIVDIGLLCGPDLDPALMKRIEVISPGDMAVKGDGIELS